MSVTPNGTISQTSWTTITGLVYGVHITEIRSAILRIQSYMPQVDNCGFSNFQSCQTTSCQSCQLCQNQC